MTEQMLNLDELFGQTKKIKVKWQGKEYELMSLDAMSPKKALQLQHFQEKARSLSIEEQPSDESAILLETLMADMLRMLSDELPVDSIPFAGKLAIMKFYVEQTQGKKILEDTPIPTGAMSSAS